MFPAFAEAWLSSLNQHSGSRVLTAALVIAISEVLSLVFLSQNRNIVDDTMLELSLLCLVGR